jgi:rubrerythrin
MLECTTGKTGCGDAGRRPAGLADADPARASDAVGAWLARVARLEAASVVAFRRLAAELEGLGAPRALVHQARRSARDETRHARVTARLARSRGARPARVRVARAKARSARDMAVENAVEGCVRESFAALVATWQARHAKDPAIARAMAGIARDETRHAALAWSVASWLDARLDEGARAEVAAATRTALEALRREVASTPAVLSEVTGLPRGSAATALLEGFASALFL